MPVSMFTDVSFVYHVSNKLHKKATQRWDNIQSTLIQRHDVKSTLNQCLTSKRMNGRKGRNNN